MLVLSDFADQTTVRHGFLTRQGGVSQGVYASLNCGPGSSDAMQNVIENRGRAAQRAGFPPDALLTLRQEHTADVVIVTETWSMEAMPVADAMVTRTPGLLLGILTADCAPVLFVDPLRRIVGAAHAGWKGAIGGVLEATIRAMEALGAERSDIRAAIGPCIAQSSYEVGAEFCDNFLHDDAENQRFFTASDKTGHFQFDLCAYVDGRLQASGLKQIFNTGCDTFHDEERFFSYRRTTRRKEPDYGRHLSVIALAA